MSTDLAVTIRDIRLARQWCQTVMAEAIGVNHSYLCRLESGDRVPSLAVLQRIARRMHLTEEEMERLGRAVLMGPDTTNAVRVNGARVIRLRREEAT